MFPVLFHWKFLTLHTYGLFAALAFLSGSFFTGRWGRRWGVDPAAVSDATVAMLLGGLAGARLLYVGVHFSEFAAAPLDVFKIWRGGLMWHGCLLGGGAAGFFQARRKGWGIGLFADVFAPAVALAQAVGRTGCFFAGCCYGRACGRPWAVTFRNPDGLAPTGLPLHPTQLYDAGLNGLIFGALIFLAGHPRFRPGSGRSAALYLALAALARLAVEPFRGDDRGILFGAVSATQVIAAGFAVGALWFLAARRPLP